MKNRTIGFPTSVTLFVSLAMVCGIGNTTAQQDLRRNNPGDLRRSHNVPSVRSETDNRQFAEASLGQVKGATTYPVSKVAIPARVSGPIEAIYVAEMQEIGPDDLLAKIDTSLVQLQVESAKVRAEAAQAKAADDVAIRYAIKSRDLAKKEMEINQGLQRTGAATRQEYERSKLAYEQADLQIERSRHEFEVAQKEAVVEEFNVKAAETQLAQHMITSPLYGNVIQLHKQPGEWVREGDEVFTVMRMDRMRVEGLVELRDYSPSQLLGRPVTVTLSTGGRQELFTGKIVMINLEGSSSSYRVRAEVDNRRDTQNVWLLLANVGVDMRIHLE
ncbi:MAG TPA: efflux RND transporter periplasmic adaptor subunit [Pirellulaceae bacterium]|nr:efflux RND transporter periplasmic adaptor subunit [Pirellulaceae bacterium]HMO90734.1 efflux RND transporter periplasmic adaptor subunit [Pirellulaceae bacterium]HMP67985.1 efflux RND transporter periplasmic adaptor subunit [Pirellulaceae bacterium]